MLNLVVAAAAEMSGGVVKEKVQARACCSR